MKDSNQINMAIFKKDSPSIKDVLFWENRPDLIPVIQEKLMRHYQEYTENKVSLYNINTYTSLCRGLSLAKHYKMETFFKEALEIYIEISQGEDEILEGILSSYINQFPNKDHESYLLEIWNELTKEIHEAEFFVISLLLSIKCTNQKFITAVKEIYYKDPEWLSYDIIQGIDEPGFQATLLANMRMIAPMVKYLKKDRILNPYYSEMLEEGVAWLDKNHPEKINKPNDESKFTKDFFTQIIGFTSEESSNLLLEKLKQLKDTSDYDEEMEQYQNSKDLLFEEHFFKNLPPTMKEWLESPFVLQVEKDEFLEFKQVLENDLKEQSKMIGEALQQSTKVGRNDPCPCGSQVKYKKCCLGKEGL